MLLIPSWLELVRVRSPSTVLSSSSRMSVTADSTTWGLAPGRTVLTETIGGSTSGNSRTDNWKYPSTPKSTRARLSMLASTGRRMDRSESFIGLPAVVAPHTEWETRGRSPLGPLPYGTCRREIHFSPLD